MSAEQMRMWLPAVRGLGDAGAAVLHDEGLLQPLLDGEVYRDLFLFMALTGCRTSEALRLKRSGITRVRPLAGGLDAWIESGFPVSVGHQ